MRSENALWVKKPTHTYPNKLWCAMKKSKMFFVIVGFGVETKALARGILAVLFQDGTLCDQADTAYNANKSGAHLSLHCARWKHGCLRRCAPAAFFRRAKGRRRAGPVLMRVVPKASPIQENSTPFCKRLVKAMMSWCQTKTTCSLGEIRCRLML